jgi:pimeloyl-ACP methyl ester carboxylesterase
MQLRRYRILLGVPVFLLVLGAGYGAYRAIEGTPGFYAWKWLSGQAHGGRYITSNGVRIYFETYGSGEPVLVLHGGLGCIEGMHRQIRALAGQYFVIAPDSRSHGRSGDADGPLTYAQLARDMVTLLDELNLPSANIVGWSDGGITGLELAMRYPHRVRKLVAIGANYDVQGMIEMPAIGPEIPPLRGSCGRVQTDPSSWPSRYRKVIEMWRSQPNYSLADLGKIRAPTLIMAGEFDSIRRSHTSQLAEAISRSQEIIIEGGTHSAGPKAAIINDNILRFLAAHGVD